ncbi:hypothetical protein H4R18_001436 [Coemansia javaensis]|uniref:Nicotinamide phosphoribosyltransferase n=1 Tax=Coemansia javaensis TaxID=2761396 RepID=A0A9W8HF59_9FUNG|nr:hypothetical protein H4R18_001436 [Coemansia javaensis]
MSGPFGLPLPLLTDSYKASHAALYPDAQQAVAYAEFRHGLNKDAEDERIVFYGLRYVIEEYVQRQWTERDVDAAAAFFSTHNAGHTPFPFPRDLFLRFVRERNGYFPVRIQALPEGSVVYPHTPVIQITADGEYAGLVTYLETVLLMTWYPSTVATVSRRAWAVVRRYYELTVDRAAWGATLGSRLHDFGFRACTCVEQSMLGGAAHLLSFDGTDTLSAAYYVQHRLNGGRAVGTSIPATEHSVMMAFRSEREAVLRLIAEYGAGAYACVMDSYDYTRALAEVLPAVAERKLARGGFLVVRPDSGDQVAAVLAGLRAAERVFGSTVNGRGFRVIRGAGVIQGDGVTPALLERILAAVRAAGFSAECVAFGMGGELLQKINRDSASMAVKLSAITYADGSARDIMKFPAAGPGKTSLPGRFAVLADPAQAGAPVAHRRCDVPADAPDLLQTVYDCGPVAGHRWDDFDAVRARLADQWARMPPRAAAVSEGLLAHQQAIRRAGQAPQEQQASRE